MNRYSGALLRICLLVTCFGKGWAQEIPDTIPDQHLEEVVVIAKLPELEIQADKITYHLDASPIRKQGNLYEVLETLPGVVVNQDGTIYLNGQSGITVLMDGKPTHLSGQELINLLKSTPAATADKIDLITHPSAKYDAAGNAGMIDIHTKKIKLQGLNLSVSSGFTQGRYGKGNGSFSLNCRNKKFNFFLTYSYYQGTDRNVLDIRRIFSHSLTGLNEELSMQQHSVRRSPYKAHYYRTGMDIYLSPLTTFGFYTSGNLLRNRNIGEMNSGFYLSPFEVPDSTLHTLNVSERRKNNLTSGINLTQRLDPDGRKMLDVSFDYLYFDYAENQSIYNTFRNEVTSQLHLDSINGDINGTIHLYTGQANLLLPMDNGWEINAGGKFSYVSINNEAMYRNREMGMWKPSLAYSQDFSYWENINAAYLQASTRFGRLSLQAGLRLENTRMEGRQATASRDSIFKDHYTRLFPTVLLEYPLRKGKLSLFYGRRIVRPNYGDLNPSVYIFDDYTYEQGNTLLQPQMTDNVEIAYSLKELFKLGFLFSYTSDAIVKSYIVEEDKRAFVTPLNLSEALTLGPRINTGILPLTDFWKVNAHAAFIFNRYKWSEELAYKVNKQATWIAGMNHHFTFGKGWSAEVSASYNGRMAAGQAMVSPVWQVHAGLQKKVLKDKGSITLTGKDIFHSYRSRMSLTIPEQSAYTNERADNTIIGISFSYRFSRGYNKKDSRRESSIDESKRINL